ncbi:MAG: GHKL domain-containing protein [Bacteroidales bacterium]|nr:GHKL domain-containing protein [Bacteroidales bacterium]
MKKYFYNFLRLNKTALILIIIVVLLYFVLSIVNKRLSSKQYIASKIEKNLSSLNNTIEKDGEKFVFINDTLVFWDKNDIAIEKVFNRELDKKVVKLGNGYFLSKKVENNDTITLYLALIKREYSINNKYLVNSFNEKFGITKSENIEISLKETPYKIRDENNNTIFYLDFSSYNPKRGETQTNLLTILYFLIVLLVLQIIYNLKIKTNKYLTLLIIPLLFLYFFIINYWISSYKDIVSLAKIIGFDILFLQLIIKIFLANFATYILIRKLLEKIDLKPYILYPYLIIISLISAFLLSSFLSIIPILVVFIFTSILLIFAFNAQKLKKILSYLLYITLVLVIFALICGVLIFESNKKKERIYIENALYEISYNEDEKTQESLLLLEKKFKENNTLDSLLDERISNKEIEEILINNYLNNLLLRYNAEVLVCYEKDTLFIPYLNKDVSALEYISLRLSLCDTLYNSQNIYKEKRESPQRSYIAFFSSNEKQDKEKRLVFIDLIQKKSSKEMGYPDLLIEKDNKENEENLELDSYAIYHNNELILQNGNNNYPLKFNFKDKTWKKQGEAFYYSIKNKKENTIFVSQIRQKSTSDILSIPSYLFLLWLLILILVFIIYNPKKLFLIKGNSIARSIQASLIFIFLITFLVFGSLSIKYFSRLETNTNKDILLEKTQSICYSLEEFFNNHISEEKDLYEELLSLSNTFLTDINVYDTNGFLIESSRPKIFSYKIASRLISSEGLKELKSGNSPIIYKTENIGNRKYRATYMPIRSDVNNKNVAYLHIPYIIQQKTIENRILEFVSAFINVYVLLITLSFILAILLSNFIIRPLLILQQSLIKIGLGKENEKIRWKRQDELQGLINAYNEMVDKLEESTKLLLKKEREEAWKEMAKQVAHDIKNPLTPMKLSIQQLERLQKEDIVEFHKSFIRIAPAIIEQINTLSSIASEFSSYAKSETLSKEKINLSEILEKAVALFRSSTLVEINYKNDIGKEDIILANKEQIVRVFNNIIKNSLEAIGDKENGRIDIEIEKQDGNCIVSIYDNGKGISDEDKEKVFSYEFTTKFSGSGLGLSIVKSIIEEIGGNIHFVSSKNKGTTFFVCFPIVKE